MVIVINVPQMETGETKFVKTPYRGIGCLLKKKFEVPGFRNVFNHIPTAIIMIRKIMEGCMLLKILSNISGQFTDQILYHGGSAFYQTILSEHSGRILTAPDLCPTHRS